MIDPESLETKTPKKEEKENKVTIDQHFEHSAGKKPSTRSDAKKSNITEQGALKGKKRKISEMTNHTATDEGSGKLRKLDQFFKRKSQ